MVRREVELPAPAADVWAALTGSEELSSWFEADVEIDPRPRGRIVARHPDGTTLEGTVIAANGPVRLVIAWRDGTRLEFSLLAEGERTRLTVVEERIDAATPDRLLLEAAR